MKYKYYLFDLDGVLVNTDEIHYTSTKQAVLEVLNYDISIDKTVDCIFKSTITTNDKLKYLSNVVSFNEDTLKIIYDLKKQYSNMYFLNFTIDNKKVELMKYLKEHNFYIAVVTNTNKKSANIILRNIGIYEYIDVVISNEDVLNKKPSPDPYLKAIEILKADKKDSVIFEDSEVGIESAKNVGCDYYHIKSYLDVTKEFIIQINCKNYTEKEK